MGFDVREGPEEVKEVLRLISRPEHEAVLKRTVSGKQVRTLLGLRASD